MSVAIEQVYVVVNKWDLYCIKLIYPPLMELHTTIMKLGDGKIISTMAFVMTIVKDVHLIHFVIVVAFKEHCRFR